MSSLRIAALAGCASPSSLRSPIAPSRSEGDLAVAATSLYHSAARSVCPSINSVKPRLAIAVMSVGSTEGVVPESGGGPNSIGASPPNRETYKSRSKKCALSIASIGNEVTKSSGALAVLSRGYRVSNLTDSVVAFLYPLHIGSKLKKASAGLMFGVRVTNATYTLPVLDVLVL